MRILVIDTCSKQPFLALSEEGKLIDATILEEGKKLSAALFPALVVLLENNGWTLQNLSCLAVGTGPGSYMGMRTGATIGKSLSFALELPLLEFATPLAFFPENPSGSYACYGDAKMGEFFLMTGEIENGHVKNQTGPHLLQKEELVSYTSNKDFTFELTQLNLSWLCLHLHSQFILGNFSSASSLKLSYLR